MNGVLSRTDSSLYWTIWVFLTLWSCYFQLNICMDTALPTGQPMIRDYNWPTTCSHVSFVPSMISEVSYWFRDAPVGHLPPPATHDLKSYPGQWGVLFPVLPGVVGDGRVHIYQASSTVPTLVQLQVRYSRTPAYAWTLLLPYSSLKGMLIGEQK